MARLPGLERKQAGWLVRIMYFFARRMLGRVPEPTRILGHHPRLLRAVGHMELGQKAARSLPEALKKLVSLKAAAMVGCPF